MAADVELLPLHLLEAFSAAMKGERGELDAWLEVNNEDDVRLHVEAYARACVAHATAAQAAEIEALRAEVAKRDGIDPWAVLLRAQEAEARAERLAEALREAKRLGDQGDWRAEREVICTALNPSEAASHD